MEVSFQHSESDQGSSSSSLNSLPASSSPSFPNCSPFSSARIESPLPLRFRHVPNDQISQTLIGRQNKGDVCDGSQKIHAEDLKHIGKSVRGRKKSLISSRRREGYSKRKACCRCMGAHAADCAAICCCPCAIFSILGIVFIDLPSALAKRSISYIKKRASVTEGTDLHQEKHGCDARFTLTPAMSEKESSKGIKEHQAIHIFRFDTENLLKHFGVEQLGFGCLTQHVE